MEPSQQVPLTITLHPAGEGFYGRLAGIPAVIYRHFDSNGVLLYIGSTHELQFGTCQARHARTARWWRYVDRIEKEVVATRYIAYDLEHRTIKKDEPIFNRLGGKRAAQKLREERYMESQGDPADHVVAPRAEVPVGGGLDSQVRAGAIAAGWLAASGVQIASAAALPGDR